MFLNNILKGGQAPNDDSEWSMFIKSIRFGSSLLLQLHRRSKTFDLS